MKKRVQIDSTLLALCILATFLFGRFPQLYAVTPEWDDLFDVLGMAVIVSGVFLRMMARGHKKAFSKQGAGLVNTGLYALSRNPMYLGSFMLGCGFILTVWPWWSLPVFAVLFYLRFRRQILIEEKHLMQLFGQSYEEYCRRTPRLLPGWRQLRDVDLRQSFPWDEGWDTKEKRGLFWWPMLAVFLEIIQGRMVFGAVEIGKTAVLAAGTWGIVALGSWAVSRRK